MAYFRRVIPILLIVIVFPPNLQAGNLMQDRLVRSADAGLRNRLAIAHLVRGEPMKVNAISLGQEEASAEDHYNVGMALTLTGRYIQASESFYKAISISVPGSNTRLEAIEQFIRMSYYNPGLGLPALNSD